MESVKNVLNKKICHDCGKKIEIANKEIKNGVGLKYKSGEEEVNIFKCFSCYEKNPSLKNFQKCEVYSRVVGYIRPVQQWHKGKQQEFAERKEFEIRARVC